MNVPITYPTLRLFLDGMLLMMMLYTLISFLWHRRPALLFYGIYLGSTLLYLFLNDLYHHLDESHVPTRYVQVAMLAESVMQCLSFVIYGQFAIRLMNLRVSDPTSVRLIQFITGLSLALILVDIACFMTGTIGSVYQEVFHNLSRYVLAGCALATVPRILRLRNQVVTFFIVGTLFYVCGALLGLIMYQMGWATRQPELPITFPMILMEVGILLEAFCLSMGLSFQNRQTEQQKIRYQTQLIEQLRQNEQKQQQLNDLRDEIARDLHDEMGSQLASISILSQATARYVTDERARQRLTTISQTARQVMDSMREIVWSLNSSSDTIQHIGLRIRDTAQHLFGDTNTRLYVRIPDNQLLHTLTAKQRRELHLIAKECLTNVLRHAQASKVGIHVWSESNTLRLTISDDGAGFDCADLASGLGLTSVRQRARQLNASLRIESEPGDGTTITLLCPLSTKTPASELLPDEEPLAYSPSDLSTAA